MHGIIKGKRTTWIDIQNPTEKDVDYLKNEFKFHPLVLEELLPPSHRSKVEVYPDYLFMVFYYPVYTKAKRETRPREIDIIATKDTIITSHYFSILPLRNLFRKGRKYSAKTSGYLLYHILDEMWKSSLTKLTRINERMDEIEKEIFAGREKEMVLEISLVKTDIINFWRIMQSQKQILESLSEEGPKFFGKDLSHYFTDILGTFNQIWNSIGSHKETILALEDTNQSLLSTKTNEIMRMLTVFSVIFLPLTLAASIWGMNIPNMPLTTSTLGFWIIIIIMVSSVGLMINFFRKKRWL